MLVVLQIEKMLVFSFFIALAIFSNVATAFVLQPRPESYKFVHKFSFLNKKSDLMPYNKPMALASNPLDQLFNSDVFQEPATSDAKLNRSPVSFYFKFLNLICYLTIIYSIRRVHLARIKRSKITRSSSTF